MLPVTWAPRTLSGADGDPRKADARTTLISSKEMDVIIIIGSGAGVAIRLPDQQGSW